MERHFSIVMFSPGPIAATVYFKEGEITHSEKGLQLNLGSYNF